MNIRELRKKAHLTQDQLAGKMNVSRSTVAMWEIGAIMPNTKKLPALAVALGVTVDALFQEETV